jgi:hypothetical protein
VVMTPLCTKQAIEVLGVGAEAVGTTPSQRLQTPRLGRDRPFTCLMERTVMC